MKLNFKKINYKKFLVMLSVMAIGYVLGSLNSTNPLISYIGLGSLLILTTLIDIK